jgi:dUTP pyrophosphatase
MDILIKKTEFVPKQGTEHSIGYDVVATTDPEINGEFLAEDPKLYSRINYIQYKTSVFLVPDLHEVVKREVKAKILATNIYPRSSISKYNLILKNSVGICDADYTGEYLLRFAYTIQPEDLVIKNNRIYATINHSKIYKKGDKCGQLIFTSGYKANFHLVDELPTTIRGAGGFGSTKK